MGVRVAHPTRGAVTPTNTPVSGRRDSFHRVDHTAEIPTHADDRAVALAPIARLAEWWAANQPALERAFSEIEAAEGWWAFGGPAAVGASVRELPA